MLNLYTTKSNLFLIEKYLVAMNSQIFSTMDLLSAEKKKKIQNKNLNTDCLDKSLLYREGKIKPCIPQKL